MTGGDILFSHAYLEDVLIDGETITDRQNRLQISIQKILPTRNYNKYIEINL